MNCGENLLQIQAYVDISLIYIQCLRINRYEVTWEPMNMRNTLYQKMAHKLYEQREDCPKHQTELTHLACIFWSFFVKKSFPLCSRYMMMITSTQFDGMLAVNKHPTSSTPPPVIKELLWKSATFLRLLLEIPEFPVAAYQKRFPADWDARYHNQN